VVNSVNILTALENRDSRWYDGYMSKHAKSHKWSEDNTEPSLRQKLKEGVTTTKELNWPNPPLALRWKEGQALAASSRLWLDHITTKAAPRRHLLAGGVRYSLTSLETTRGSLKNDPARVVGLEDLRRLAAYGVDVQDLYEACYYARLSYGARNGAQAMALFAGLTCGAISLRAWFHSLKIRMYGHDAIHTDKTVADRISASLKSYQAANPEAERIRAKNVGRGMKRLKATMSPEKKSEWSDAISRAKMAKPKEERSAIYRKARTSNTTYFKTQEGQLLVAGSSWEASMYSFLERVIPGRFVFQNTHDTVIPLNHHLKKDWNVDFIIDDALILDVKGHWAAEKKFTKQDLPAFLGSTFSNRYSLVLVRFDVSKRSYRTFQEMLHDADWYRAAGDFRCFA
jgi:hypothetical protein